MRRLIVHDNNLLPFGMTPERPLGAVNRPAEIADGGDEHSGIATAANFNGRNAAANLNTRRLTDEWHDAPHTQLSPRKNTERFGNGPQSARLFKPLKQTVNATFRRMAGA